MKSINTYTIYRILNDLPAISHRISIETGLTFSSILKIMPLMLKMGIVSREDIHSGRTKGKYMLTSDGKKMLTILSRIYDKEDVKNDFA